jgi:outer membrane lipoprotein-sorting protein
MSTHEDIKGLLVGFALQELSEQQSAEVEAHLTECQQCSSEFRGLQAVLQCAASRRELSADERMCESAKQALFATVADRGMEEPTARPSIGPALIWRTIMKRPIAKLAAAAVIVAAVVLSINVWDKSIGTASATELLQRAIDAVSDVWSVHMKARMRTLPRDNFSLIGLDYDFVPIEMWKRTDENGHVQWRVEKPGRVLLMDGQTTIMFIRPNHGVLMEQALPLGCYDSWSGRLLNVHELLDDELQKAKNNPDREVRLLHQEVEGRDKLVLEVHVRTSLPEDDYLRNKFISESDHVKVYEFDAKTRLLESLQVYVHAEDKDVLIFEVTDIEYNAALDDSVFALDLPENMIWAKEPAILPDNERYEKMTPKEAAEAFFQACANEDWEEVLKFRTESRIDERTKEYLGGLQIISIGEPFQSEGYARDGLGWFVPYEIRLRPVERNAALSNANSAGRFVITGWYDKEGKLLEQVKWSEEPEILANNDTYAKMSPADVVKAYYDALSRLDWDEMRKSMPPDDVENLKHQCDEAAKYNIDIQKQLPTVEIEKSFWSAEHSSYFVTYREFRVKQFNLAIRKDNLANRFVVDGGL